MRWYACPLSELRSMAPKAAPASSSVPSFYAFPSVGSFFVLVSFVVVVLGGLGSVAGTMVGGLVLGLVETATGYFAPDLKEATHFILLILLLTVRPQGLLGVRGAEKETLK